jgi:hypothetical protein
VDTFSCISFFSNYSEPIKGKDIRKKIEDIWNVSITYPVFNNIDKESKQEGRGGYILEDKANSPGLFYIKRVDQMNVSNND